MNTAISTTLIFSSNWSARTCLPPRWMMSCNGGNSKSEARSTKQIPGAKAPKRTAEGVVSNIRVLCFKFISNFGFRISCFAAIVAASGAIGVSTADDSYSQNASRLEQMTPEQKEELARKKAQFDVLTEAEKQHLREIHAAITADPGAKELSETATKYARWLANLEPTDRAPLLDIKDPKQRIARI